MLPFQAVLSRRSTPMWLVGRQAVKGPRLLANGNCHSFLPQENNLTLCFLYFILSIPRLGPVEIWTTDRVCKWLFWVEWSASDSVQQWSCREEKGKRRWTAKSFSWTLQSSQLLVVQTVWISCWSKQLIVMDFPSISFAYTSPFSNNLASLILRWMIRYRFFIFVGNFAMWNLSEILQDTVNHCSLRTVSVTLRI